jgi:hypothetical protein
LNYFVFWVLFFFGLAMPRSAPLRSQSKKTTPSTSTTTSSELANVIRELGILPEEQNLSVEEFLQSRYSKEEEKFDLLVEQAISEFLQQTSEARKKLESQNF